MISNLVELLEYHAQKSLDASPTNALYAARVRLNATRVSELLASRTGEVSSVVSTWRADFKPIAEAVFGLALELRETDELQISHSEFTQTTMDGIDGRVTRISDDEIMGPMLSLDLKSSKRVH